MMQKQRRPSEFHELGMSNEEHDELVEEYCKGNGELGGVKFLVGVRPTTRGFSKSFSRRELKEELNTSVENSAAFHYANQANFNIVYKLIYRRKERKKFVGEALQT